MPVSITADNFISFSVADWCFEVSEVQHISYGSALPTTTALTWHATCLVHGTEPRKALILQSREITLRLENGCASNRTLIKCNEITHSMRKIVWGWFLFHSLWSVGMSYAPSPASRGPSCFSSHSGYCPAPLGQAHSISRTSYCFEQRNMFSVSTTQSAHYMFASALFLVPIKSCRLQDSPVFHIKNDY